MNGEENNREYLSLEKLEVYRLARELSRFGWPIYMGFAWQVKKVIGDQFLESTDSIGANIAEGYGRFHYLDKAKFYYNARGSLLESCHWMNLLKERGLVSLEEWEKYQSVYTELAPKLNGLIRATQMQRNRV